MIARFITTGLLACTVSINAWAQASLENLVSEASAEWMFGQWQTQTDNGDTVSLTIGWDLEKHVVTLHVKAPEMESKGYTVMESSHETPRYYTFDNRGAVGKGSWNMENDELVLRVDTERPGGETRKAAFVFGGSSSKGLEVRMHTVDSSGSLSSDARMTLKFKKRS
jgi:hypothetical protein